MPNTHEHLTNSKLSDSIKKTLTHILPLYNCSLNTSKITCIGNGLINDTFLVESSDTCFVLQRINTHVFPQPQSIVENAELIHQHLQQKTQNKSYPFNSIGHVKNIHQNALTCYENSDKKEYWRALDYISNSVTIEAIETTQQAELMANAFAQFTTTLSDLDARKLNETIPNFHNINTRLQQLNTALNACSNSDSDKKKAQRIQESQTLISFIEHQKAFVKQVNELSTHLPLRVTHNDTKINNLLFSHITLQPVAVIDLDTCMPGFLMNDFGDLVRTCCPNIDENSTDLHSMTIRMDIFKAIARGYLTAFNNNLSTHEKESLVVGSQLIPFMLAIRFLTDYINGNVYFQTAYAEQNLDRAKNQFHIFALLQEKHNELFEIVNAM
ncbi:phosphotransferase enzyme family protein [Colwellia sp. RE-S-Sl-9]